MKKGIIFDFNGVLMDTIGLQYESWRSMLEEFGISFSPEEYRKKANGVKRRNAIVNILGKEASEDLIQRMFERKDEILQNMLRQIAPDDHRLQLLPGVEMMLQILTTNSIKTAVASSSSNVALMLQASGADVYFDSILSGDEYLESKPSPQIYEVAATRMGLTPQECVVVEDSTQGLLAAKKLGIKTVGLTRSHDVQPGMADLTLESLREYRILLDMFFPEIVVGAT